MTNLLDNHNIDIVGISESKRSENNPVSEIHKDYSWIGKNRSGNAGGGIGFLVNKKTVSITDDNLLNTQSDEFERLWISVKVDQAATAVGITYFPVDNINTNYELANELCNELIQNVGELQRDYENILLMGDFNGKISEFLRPGKQSSNGKLVEKLVDVTNLVLLNTDEKCNGKITWCRGPLQSVIDYVMCSPGMYEMVKSVTIDEEQQYSIGSDHNFILTCIDFPTTRNQKSKCKSEKIQRWNISDKSNWETFKNVSQEMFADWDPGKFCNVNDMWEDFKQRLTSAGMKSIGYKQYCNKRKYWDKEISTLIKNRRTANKLYRIWSQHPNCSPDLLALLWDDYQDKKRKVADSVKENAIKHKTKVIFKHAEKSSKNPRAYWNTLKRLNKSNDYPLKIRDPDNPDVLIDDPLIIKKKLTSYWSKLGNSDNHDAASTIEKLEKLQCYGPQPDSLQSISIDRVLVTNAIKKMKNFKATGTDNLPGEFFKYCHQSAQSALLDMFSQIKLLEQIPDEWTEGIVKPLYKEGTLEMLPNYIGITISSVAYKTLVILMEDQIMSYIETRCISAW